MRCLIVELPPPHADAATLSGGWRHAWLERLEDPQPPAVRSASLALLPRPERQTLTVAVVPAAALSWHALSLPAALRRGRHSLASVLSGLLEERLLDDPARLHLALGPGTAAAQGDAPVWVAACDREWLRQRLQTLAQAGLVVERLLPELPPPAQGRQLWLTGADEDSGQLWCADARQGVWSLPLAALQTTDSLQALGLPPVAAAPGAADATPEPLAVQAEPALARWAQTRLETDPVLADAGQRWLQALASGWDLAQFDFALGRGTRRLQALRQGVSRLLLAPAWRPARWGLGLLLAVQLAGLNLWAWRVQADWTAQRNAMAAIVTETFPALNLVIDAPRQMQREVERLAQATGQRGPQDFESLMQALDPLWPGPLPPTALRYDGQRLRLEGVQLSAAAEARLREQLGAQGYRWQREGANATVELASSVAPATAAAGLAPAALTAPTGARP